LWTGLAGYSETDARQEFIRFLWKGNQQPETNGKLYPENELYWRLISGILFIKSYGNLMTSGMLGSG